MSDSTILKRAFLLLICAVISGCKEKRPTPTEKQIQLMQTRSSTGETSSWRLSSAKWAGETQLMRDRAYLFCLERHANDAACINQQDWSLIASNHAEGIAEDYIRRPDVKNPYSVGFSLQPSRWSQIRSECFAVYKDAGARDARMLGPCLIGALGGDYFGVVGVP